MEINKKFEKTLKILFFSQYLSNLLFNFSKLKKIMLFFD